MIDEGRPSNFIFRDGRCEHTPENMVGTQRLVRLRVVTMVLTRKRNTDARPTQADTGTKCGLKAQVKNKHKYKNKTKAKCRSMVMKWRRPSLMSCRIACSKVVLEIPDRW